MRELKYINEVVTLTLDPEKCTGCGMCLTRILYNDQIMLSARAGHGKYFTIEILALALSLPFDG